MTKMHEVEGFVVADAVSTRKLSLGKAAVDDRSAAATLR
jgi:hypothetical protein